MRRAMPHVAVLVALFVFATTSPSCGRVVTQVLDFWLPWNRTSSAGGLVCSECYNDIYVLNPTYECHTSESFDRAISHPLLWKRNLSKLEVTIIGSYNCEAATENVQGIASINLLGWVVSNKLPLPDVASCSCPNCGTPVSVSLDIDPPEMPQQDQNMLSVVPSQNTLCLAVVHVAVSYLTHVPGVSRVAPLLSPVSGGTVLSVSGEAFDPLLPTQCDFGPSLGRTPATVVSPSLLLCTSPQHPYAESLGSPIPGMINVSFSVVFQPPEEAPVTSQPFLLWYYHQPKLTSVTPSSASMYGATPVVVAGERLFRSEFTLCRFQYGASANVTPAVHDEDHLHCQVPRWPSAQRVNLSISLNGQQYTDPISFSFVDKSSMDLTQWLIVGSLAVVLVAVLVLFGYVVGKRSAVDGYTKIREGNIRVDLKEIHIGALIGRGNFGEVYKGTWRGAVVAVKRLVTAQVNDDFLREFEKEVGLMRALRAPNILQFLGSAFEPPNICIVIEYMSRGSLYGILHNPAIVLEWPLILRMLADTARGMTYLHTCKPPIIHRDLKSHNLLVDEFWKVKVCDFGLSTIMERQSQTMTACGTPCWTAPEVLKHLHYTVKADVYSFGIVMWECISRADPYAGMPPFKVIYAVPSEGLRPKLPSWCPQPFSQLAQRCWDSEAARRPEFVIALELLEEMNLYGWRGQPGAIDGASGCSSPPAAFGDANAQVQMSGFGGAAVLAPGNEGTIQ